jgi:maltose-binding protein MalE
MFLQLGTEMTDSGYNNATFAATGADAFDFYLSFANPSSAWFSWDKNNPSAFASFISGESAFFFGFLRDKKVIQDSAPFMNLGVLEAPQFALENNVEVNLADYYGLSISSQTTHPNEAQQFVLYATADPASNTDFLNSVGESPALRSLISDEGNNPDLKVWLSQALTAKAWQEPDLNKVIGIFDKAIDQVNFAGQESYFALREAEASVSNLMRGF